MLKNVIKMSITGQHGFANYLKKSTKMCNLKKNLSKNYKKKFRKKNIKNIKNYKKKL